MFRESKCRIGTQPLVISHLYCGAGSLFVFSTHKSSLPSRINITLSFWIKSICRDSLMLNFPCRTSNDEILTLFLFLYVWTTQLRWAICARNFLCWELYLLCALIYASRCCFKGCNKRAVTRLLPLVSVCPFWWPNFFFFYKDRFYKHCILVIN